MAWAVRVLVFLAPLVVGWVAVRSLSAVFLRPSGWLGVVCWGLQALVVASLAATVVDRLAQRALPLATLMGMSLTFPDQAPSRFGVAMRAGTVRKLRSQLEALARDGLGDDPQEAAERAIELVTVLGRHDRLTRGHTERVRAYADLIAEELGLEPDDRRLLAWGVTLHDIGKLTVPPEILNKDGRPTDEEWAILSAHPAEGAKMIEPLAGWLGDWAKAAGEHHERWDGNGYPNKLAGTEISLAGRITAVADAYDVITSHRSYKTPLSIGAARKELVDCAGTQFDPSVVRALLQASLRRHRPRVGFFSWLPELPALATVSQGIAAAPAAAATVAIAATAPLTGIAPPEPPTDLAFTSTPTSIIVEEEQTTRSSDQDGLSTTTSGAVAGSDLPSGSDPTVSAETTTSLAPDGTERPPSSTEPGLSVPEPNPTSTPTPTTVAPTTTTTAPTTSTTAAGAGPSAQDDDGTQREGKQKQYPVLDNDVPGGAQLDPTTLTVITPPAHGTAEPWASDKIRYLAVDGYIGTVTIVYEICDTGGLCGRATLTVTLTA